jgi:transcriptional regulator with XRE-family HTH domain
MAMNSTSKEKITVPTSKDTSVATNLKLQIKNHIESMGTNVRALERKAGLNIGTVNNILHGTSANPTAETLIALAKVFECTIDDLLNRKDIQESHKLGANSKNFQTFKWNPTLFSSIVTELNKQIEDKHISINSDKALIIIHDVYLYSLKKNKEIVEESLVEWLLDKSL